MLQWLAPLKRILRYGRDVPVTDLGNPTKQSGPVTDSYLPSVSERRWARREAEAIIRRANELGVYVDLTTGVKRD